MDGHLGPALRWSRALAISAVAAGSAGAAHVLAGGRLPGPIALAVLFAMTLAVAASALGRLSGTRRVVLLVVLAQTAFHGWLTMLAGHGYPTGPHVHAAAAGTGHLPPAAPGTLSEALGYDQLMASGAIHSDPVADALAHLAADLSGDTLVMSLAHLAAALVLGWWLAAGERAIIAVLAALTARLLAAGCEAWRSARRLQILLQAARAALVPTAPEPLNRRRVLELASQLTRRGPPLRVLATS